MKKLFCLIIAAAALSVSAKTERPDTEGARPGIWTHDYAAAVKFAGENSLPLLLNFTGSDWCPWCILMDEKVFSTAEWKNWAKDNVMMVFVDFPRDKSLVPAKFAERNKKLSEKFNVEGFPTFIVLSSDASETIGQLGASRDITPAAFIGEMESIVINSSEGGAEAFLSAEEAKTLGKLKAESAAVKAKCEEFNTKAEAEFTELYKAVKSATDAKAKTEAERKLKEWNKKASEDLEKLTESLKKLDESISKLTGKAVKEAKAAKTKETAK